jgi:putative flavoprotein involved in K+ transport
MAERHDVVIVGAGQAGLAMSFELSRRGVEHVLFERSRIAERWRSARWDSLAFQLPNRMLALPGKSYGGDAPDGFARHDEVLRFLEAYAAEIAAPVRTGTEVLALRRDGTAGYLMETRSGEVAARQVVIATGPFHEPVVPAFAAALPASVGQTDAARYRSPEALPEGAVLVVGSGSSGTQIADELLAAGRRVFLSVGRHRYAPRRYRGRDVIWWYEALGRFDVPIDQFPDRRYPPPTVMTGVAGGYDLFPRALVARGAELLGRIVGCSNGVLEIAGDRDAILQAADASCRDFLAAADALAAARGLEGAPGSWTVPPPLEVEERRSLDLAAEGVGAVVWACGYRGEYGWVKLPLFDGSGTPVQRRGVTECPGVYFLGLHWMHTFRSGLLSYVGADAAYLAEEMTGVP